MGVTGLWSILHPCARPIKLETLNRKRLAVDASIWIYQFLKAVRDKEGNALRNSHIVGFFRRICKLLFFGIRPVFVFDGGAPVLKRQTVSERKKRREGRRDDAVRTAGKLLAVQMQRRAEEEEARQAGGQQQGEEDEVPGEGEMVYVDEIGMSAQERQQTRRFKKKDAYHLPDLDSNLHALGQPNDPRIMSLEDLQAYAKQFQTGDEDINVYDFSKIDYDSSFFTSLPASDRYNILNAARLRSRLRMGHSKEQLDTMFPNRMEFSKFQIDRVKERNELTQRLMHLNEGGDTLFDTGGGRVAGEKGREYVLVKNDGVEGGWALGVISDEGTKRETAIDLEKPVPAMKQEDDDWEDEDDFEDVPIEGLNRLPKRQKVDGDATGGYAKQRQALYKSRKPGGARRKTKKSAVDSNSLFVTEDTVESENEETEEWEEIDTNGELFGETQAEAEPTEEDEELQRAIAMSLGKDNDEQAPSEPEAQDAVSDDDEMQEVFQQSAAREAQPLPKGSGRSIANIVNKRAYDFAPESREITSFGVPTLKAENDQKGSEDEDEAMDLQAALAESRRTKRKISSPPKKRQPAAFEKPKEKQPAKTDGAKQAGFTGPLPFEKLDLGSSLLGKKKMQERSEEAAGGFVNPDIAEKQKPVEPLPPWFAQDPEEGIEKERARDREERERLRKDREMFVFDDDSRPSLRKQATAEVIDLEGDEEQGAGLLNGEVIDLEADGEDRRSGDNGIVDLDTDVDDSVERSHNPRIDNDTVMLDTHLRMGDVAEKVRLEPPTETAEDHRAPTSTKKKNLVVEGAKNRDQETTSKPELANTSAPQVKNPFVEESEDEEAFDWSDSENEREMNNSNHHQQAPSVSTQAAREAPAFPTQPPQPAPVSASQVADTTMQQEPPRSPSADFEDVGIPDELQTAQSPAQNSALRQDDTAEIPASASGAAPQNFIPEDEDIVEDFDEFSDPEDEDLLHQLTLEAEEHARFASTLNNKTQAQNIADYENELKQLRNQQKKDRRDADEVTHVMITECQQLLRLFGLPYVTAPMEAEAQCAELVKLGLVDGIVTDDSDCFLFGGTRVYKNMFNQAKFVECYLSSDLEKEFDLTREKMIQVAHLLGSDYTEGLPGVGPVTALEILSEFATLDEFREWWSAVQMNTITKSDDSKNAFRKKFRKNATKLFLPPTFPDPRVDLAYAQPEVDSDPEAFRWGVPDLDALRSFLMMTIGWSQERTDEVLVPVIRDMNRRADEGTQSNITAFFDGGVGIGAAGATKGSAGRAEAFAPRKRVAESSKRMGNALTSLAEKARGRRGEGNAMVDGKEDKDGDEATAHGGGSGTRDERNQANGATKLRGKKSATKRKRDIKAAVSSSEEDGSDFDEATTSTKNRKAPKRASNGRKKKAQEVE